MKKLDAFDSMNTIDFIKNNYSKILEVCKAIYKDFPEVCDRVSYVLGTYLKSKFGTDIKICYGNYKGAFHVWLQLDNNIIDVTRFQFTKEKYTNFNPIVSECKARVCYELVGYYEWNAELNKIADSCFVLEEYLCKIKNWDVPWCS